MDGYLKIETDDKKEIASLIEEVIEKSGSHRIYTQQLENGNYCVEIMAVTQEPPIS